MPEGPIAQQETRRQELYSLLGDLPDRLRPISATVISQEPRASGIVENIMFDLNGIEPVPGYFARPEKLDKPAPTIIYNHAHGGDYSLGKDEFLTGRKALQQPPYVDEFLSRGWCALCIDHWAFGERAGRSESDIFKQMLWSGQVMWGMMMYDSLRAIDYLVTRTEVDASRLATIGMSMGSTMAWWLAALDPRVNVCVDICCMTDFQALIAANNLAAHGMYYYVPGLLKHFTTAQINALIAPRPHLCLAGNQDRLTPPEGLDRINAELREAYDTAGARQAWRMMRYDVGHTETPEMRREALAFLEQWLWNHGAMTVNPRLSGTRSHLRILTTVLFALLSSQLGGCVLGIPTRTLRFRAVDASTRTPLADVHVTRHSYGNTVMTYVFFAGKSGTFELPSTDAQGVVIASGLHRAQNHMFGFSKTGYLNAGADDLGDEIGLALPPTDPFHMRKSGPSVPSRGIVDVPMYPDSTPIAHYEPIWRRMDPIPADFLRLAEKALRSQKARGPQKEGQIYALANQYSEYRIIWIWHDPQLTRHEAEVINISPPDDASSYFLMAKPGAPPTPEEILKQSER